MKVYGLIGFPLSHSFSKKYFTEKFAKEGIQAVYELFEIENVSDFRSLIDTNTQLEGLNVTIPYKETIIPFLDSLDETAVAVGAVNTIKIVRVDSSVKLVGYNTDVYGFRQSIKPFLSMQHERALILGTGGAAKAVAYVLQQMGVNCLFVSRNGLADNSITYSELNEYILKSHLLIVNASPVGMFPDSSAAPDLPYEYIDSNHFLYDLVYNPEETLFLKKGKGKGAQVLNGLSMLYLQAGKAWQIWNGD